MYRSEAYDILTSDKCGYNGDEASRITERAFTTGTALTAPRNCPSMWITVGFDSDSWRVQENDSGTDYLPDGSDRAISEIKSLLDTNPWDAR